MDNIKSQINYWRKSASMNWQTAEDLFKLKHYDACLFFCHLTLEKMLKGLSVRQTRKIVPRIHDLERLSLLAKLDLSEEQLKNLRVITGFNIGGRYDDAKFAFYKKCTRSYTEKYFKISKELYLWLKEKYQKKQKSK